MDPRKLWRNLLHHITCSAKKQGQGRDDKQKGDLLEKGGNGGQNETCRKRFFFPIGLLLSVVANIIFVVIIVKDEKESHSGLGCGNVTKKYKSSMCISCDLVPVGDRWQQECDDIGLCCSDNQQPLKMLIQMSVLQQSGQQPVAISEEDKSVALRPAGHLFLNTTALHYDKWVWTTNSGVAAFLSSEIEIVNGDKLQIRTRGDYFVYSCITFKASDSVLKSVVNHYVYRFNEALPHTGNQLLLLDKTSLSGENNPYQTSFLSAVLRLRQRDQVFTRVSNMSAVYGSTYSNFMGIFKL